MYSLGRGFPPVFIDAVLQLDHSQVPYFYWKPSVDVGTLQVAVVAWRSLPLLQLLSSGLNLGWVGRRRGTESVNQQTLGERIGFTGDFNCKGSHGGVEVQSVCLMFAVKLAVARASARPRPAKVLHQRPDQVICAMTAALRGLLYSGSASKGKSCVVIVDVECADFSSGVHRAQVWRPKWPVNLLRTIPVEAKVRLKCAGDAQHCEDMSIF